MLAFIGVFGCLAATAGAQTGSERRTGATSFRNVRVCAYENFSRRLDACTRDQRGESIASSRIVCSATVRTTSVAAPVRARWTYDGLPAAAFNQVNSDGDRIWIDWNLGAGFPLPGGRYQCRFTSGKATATAVVTSSGPTGPIVDATICDERNTRRYGSDRSFYVCLRDQDAGTIALGSSIVCNAVYPSVVGHKRKIEVLDDAGSSLVTTVDARVEGPLIQAQRRYGPINKPGRDRCRFSLDGNVVTEKTIVVQ
jgi:hypothetical protein